jgi:hypothetical protein
VVLDCSCLNTRDLTLEMMSKSVACNEVQCVFARCCNEYFLNVHTCNLNVRQLTVRMQVTAMMR